MAKSKKRTKATEDSLSLLMDLANEEAARLGLSRDEWFGWLDRFFWKHNQHGQLHQLNQQPEKYLDAGFSLLDTLESDRAA